MLRYGKVPLVFLFIGSLLGLFLRWQFITPTPGVNYSFILHAHSHVMFIGWIFNALMIGLTTDHIAEKHQKIFRQLFWLLQIFVVGMLISFPLEGYGFYSILFSTLHTIGSLIYTALFFIKSNKALPIGAMYARIALVFLAISTIGPFSLGYLMSAGLGQSNWYHFAIYFYLHFQYNGFFLFGIFSLFFGILEKRNIEFNSATAKATGWILAFACLPSYLLSVIWAKPGLIYNLIGGLAGAIQLGGLWLLINSTSKVISEIKKSFHSVSFVILTLIFFAFTVKLLLQFVSALPSVAQMTYELRPLIIAYLHLVLLGVISLFMLLWYIEENFLRSGIKPTIGIFVTGFIGMEMCLIFQPWASDAFDVPTSAILYTIFFFSILLSASCGLFVFRCFNKPLESSI